MEYAFAQFLSLRSGPRWTITFSQILQSARQLVVKRGFGKVRHLDEKLLWIQSREDFNMVQAPTDSNAAASIPNHLEDEESDS